MNLRSGNPLKGCHQPKDRSSLGDETAFDRRAFVSLGSSGLAFLVLTGCTSIPAPRALPEDLPAIDPHSHVFNASDLPVPKFITIVMLSDHRDRELEDFSKKSVRGLTYALIEMLIDLLRSPAPSAVEELCMIDPANAVCRDGEAVTRVPAEDLQTDIGDGAQTRDKEIAALRRVLNPVIRRSQDKRSSKELESYIRAILGKGSSNRRACSRCLDVCAEKSDKSGQSNPVRLTDTIAQDLEEGRKELRRLLFDELKEDPEPVIQSLERGDPLSDKLLTKIFALPGLVLRYLRWGLLFLRYRYQNVNRYVRHVGGDGEIALHTPLLIDYSKWLRDDEPTSPLPMQIEAMHVIQKTHRRIRMHGYVAFDPWRQITGQRLPCPDRKHRTPLELVRWALSERGFMGVKLYPPMGFLPIGNTNLMSEEFPEDLQNLREFRQRIDDALTSLYQCCIDLGAPILSHAESSQGSGPGYECRAAPPGWAEVLTMEGGRFKDLRLCLAHFGDFEEAIKDDGKVCYDCLEETWEWQFGQFVRNGGYRNVIYDLSYLSELLGQHRRDKRRIASILDLTRRFIGEFDPDLNHLAYGSDWIMLGREPHHRKYLGILGDFFDDLRLVNPVAKKARFFSGNAARYMGLGAGEKTRERLEAYDQVHGLDPGFWSRFDQAIQS